MVVSLFDMPLLKVLFFDKFTLLIFVELLKYTGGAHHVTTTSVVHIVIHIVNDTGITVVITTIIINLVQVIWCNIFHIGMFDIHNTVIMPCISPYIYIHIVTADVQAAVHATVTAVVTVAAHGVHRV